MMKISFRFQWIVRPTNNPAHSAIPTKSTASGGGGGRGEIKLAIFYCFDVLGDCLHADHG